jgi:hypothetical protein
MAVTAGTKAPATTDPTKKPPITEANNAFESQGYCPIPLTVDVTRGITSNVVTWEFHSPAGFTKATPPALNKISAIDIYAGDAAAGAPAVTIAAEGDKVAKSAAYTYPTTEKGVCVWTADVTYQTSVGATLAGAIKGDGKPLPVYEEKTGLKAADFGFTTDTDLAASLDASAVAYPAAVTGSTKTWKPGDIVTLTVTRKARITGAVYPAAADEDWTVEDGYAPALNVNVGTVTSGYSGGRWSAAGALIPGDGVDVPTAGDFALPKYAPAGYSPTGPGGSPAEVKPGDWALDQSVTVNLADGTTSQKTWKGGAWAAFTAPTNKVWPSTITAVKEKKAPGPTGPVEVVLEGYAATAATAAPSGTALAATGIDALNDFGGIDVDACFNRGVPQPTGDLGAGIVGPGKQWPQGYFVPVSGGITGADAVAASGTAAATPAVTGTDAAYWDGSKFVVCDKRTGAPGVLVDPYQKPVKL